LEAHPEEARDFRVRSVSVDEQSLLDDPTDRKRRQTGFPFASERKLRNGMVRSSGNIVASLVDCFPRCELLGMSWKTRRRRPDQGISDRHDVWESGRHARGSHGAFSLNTIPAPHLHGRRRSWMSTSQRCTQHDAAQSRPIDRQTVTATYVECQLIYPRFRGFRRQPPMKHGNNCFRVAASMISVLRAPETARRRSRGSSARR